MPRKHIVTQRQSAIRRSSRSTNDSRANSLRMLLAPVLQDVGVKNIFLERFGATIKQILGNEGLLGTVVKNYNEEALTIAPVTSSTQNSLEIRTGCEICASSVIRSIISLTVILDAG